MGIFARKSYCKNESPLETHLGSREGEERDIGQHKGLREKIQAGIEPGDSGAVWEDGSDQHNLFTALFQHMLNLTDPPASAGLQGTTWNLHTGRFRSTLN